MCLPKHCNFCPPSLSKILSLKNTIEYLDYWAVANISVDAQRCIHPSPFLEACCVFFSFFNGPMSVFLQPELVYQADVHIALLLQFLCAWQWCCYQHPGTTASSQENAWRAVNSSPKQASHFCLIGTICGFDMIAKKTQMGCNQQFMTFLATFHAYGFAKDICYSKLVTEEIRCYKRIISLVIKNFLFQISNIQSVLETPR